MRLREPLLYILLFCEHPNNTLLSYLAYMLILLFIMSMCFPCLWILYSFFCFPVSLFNNLSSCNTLKEPGSILTHFVPNKAESKVVGSQPNIIKRLLNLESLVTESTNWMFGLHFQSQNTMIRLLSKRDSREIFQNIRMF